MSFNKFSTNSTPAGDKAGQQSGAKTADGATAAQGAPGAKPAADTAKMTRQPSDPKTI